MIPDDLGRLAGCEQIFSVHRKIRRKGFHRLRIGVEQAIYFFLLPCVIELIAVVSSSFGILTNPGLLSLRQVSFCQSDSVSPQEAPS
jgi:hypothetical protein